MTRIGLIDSSKIYSDCNDCNRNPKYPLVQQIDLHYGLVPFLLAVIPLTIVLIAMDCFYWTTLIAPLNLLIDPVLALEPFLFEGWIQRQIQDRNLLGWLLLQLSNYAYLSTLPLKFFNIKNEDYSVRFTLNWLISLLIIFPGYNLILIFTPIFNLVEVIMFIFKLSDQQFLWLSWESVLSSNVDANVI